MGLTISNKRGPFGNLHSILNCQVNYNAFQPNLPRHIIKSVIARKYIDQQEPNNKEFDRCNNNTSSDSSNNSKSAVEEDVFDEREDDDPPEEDSNRSIRENQLSIQHINVLQPPGPYLVAKIELLNIMRKHEVPPNTYKEIYSWVITSQN